MGRLNIAIVQGVLQLLLCDHVVAALRQAASLDGAQHLQLGRLCLKVAPDEGFESTAGVRAQDWLATSKQETYTYGINNNDGHYLAYFSKILSIPGS